MNKLTMNMTNSKKKKSLAPLVPISLHKELAPSPPQIRGTNDDAANGFPQLRRRSSEAAPRRAEPSGPDRAGRTAPEIASIGWPTSEPTTNGDSNDRGGWGPSLLASRGSFRNRNSAWAS